MRLRWRYFLLATFLFLVGAALLPSQMTTNPPWGDPLLWEHFLGVVACLVGAAFLI